MKTDAANTETLLFSVGLGLLLYSGAAALASTIELVISAHPAAGAKEFELPMEFWLLASFGLFGLCGSLLGLWLRLQRLFEARGAPAACDAAQIANSIQVSETLSRN